ncbi:MAG TPA: hypothetical protein VFW23_08950 [Tepidisphaeraceae bacterium]|nr:hypothetical protein [Tepidisphaeraceae bacterium]
MPDKPDTIVDLSWGVYRRQYAGYGRGRRINSISLAAEAWFWRVHSIAADDFGNLDADPILVHAATVGRRPAVTVEDVSSWLCEMQRAELIQHYEVGLEKYLHVTGFVERQPANRNGRRIRRCPPSPWDNPDASNGASGGIRGNPGENLDPENQSKNENQSEDISAATGKPATAVSADFVMEFPTVGGKTADTKTWKLARQQVLEWREIFPGVNVMGECKKALGWLKANPKRQKTARGMTYFLFQWLERTQNRGQGNNGSNGKPGGAGPAIRRDD